MSRGPGCGTCTLCCKLLGVDDGGEQLTVPGTWCRHCKPGKGCGIYDDRPFRCRDFECGWLANSDAPEFRPDRLHMIVSGESPLIDAYVVHVDPAYPDAPERPNGKLLLRALITTGRYQNVVLVTGEKPRRIIGANPAIIERRLAELQHRLAL